MQVNPLPAFHPPPLIISGFSNETYANFGRECHEYMSGEYGIGTQIDYGKTVRNKLKLHEKDTPLRVLPSFLSTHSHSSKETSPVAWQKFVNLTVNALAPTSHL